jgi:hypothetical protein
MVCSGRDGERGAAADLGITKPFKKDAAFSYRVELSFESFQAKIGGVKV